MLKQIRLYDRQSRVKQTDAIGAATTYWDPLTQLNDAVGALTTTTTWTYDKEGNLLQTQTTQDPDSTSKLLRLSR